MVDCNSSEEEGDFAFEDADKQKDIKDKTDALNGIK